MPLLDMGITAARLQTCDPDDCDSTERLSLDAGSGRIPAEPWQEHARHWWKLRGATPERA